MISVEEATQILEDTIQKIQKTRMSSEKDKRVENISLIDKSLDWIIDNLIGKIIARDLHSPINVPEFDNSAMDGFAMNVQSLQKKYIGALPNEANKETAQKISKTISGTTNSTLSIPIPISGEVNAGDSPATLTQDSCVRIFTGAAIPLGADIVIPQEHCVIDKDAHTMQIMLPYNLQTRHIRPSAQNFAVGDVVCNTGEVCSAELLSLILSAGITEITVYVPLRIAICVTGDELLQIGEPLQEGKIYDTNSLLLASHVKKLGARVDIIHIKDSYEDTYTQLRQLSTSHDFIICTGGISVGEKDYIRTVIEKCAIEKSAEIYINKVSIKPGKPFTFALFNTTPIACLPGNPLSVYITFLFFVQPYIRILQGQSLASVRQENGIRHVPAPRPYTSYPRTQFIFAHYNHLTQEFSPLEDQGSSALVNMQRANVAYIIPAHTEIAQGDPVQLYEFRKSF